MSSYHWLLTFTFYSSLEVNIVEMTNMVKNMRIVCFAYLIKQRCLPAGLLTVRCRPTSCISDNTYITRHYSGLGRRITKLRLVAPRCLLDLQPHHFSKNNSPQLLTCVSRLASEARSEINIDNLSHELFIEGWFQEVSPFGSLTIHDVPFDIYIQPLSLTEHPQMNKSIVKMFYDARCDSKGDEVISGRKLSELSRLCEMNVTVTNEGQQMNIACKLPPGVELPVVCIVFVPIKFGKYVYICRNSLNVRRFYFTKVKYGSMVYFVYLEI